MNFDTVFMAVLLTLFVFIVAYGLLKIFETGFTLGRHAAWETKENRKPTDPSKAKGFYDSVVVPAVPSGPEGPPVYSPREPLVTEQGPFDPVPPHAETQLPPG